MSGRGAGAAWRILGAVLLAALAAGAAGAQTQWALEKSTITYHVTHPLHHVEGVSHAARGKGVCYSGECSFLIAAPVKSFASGDTNRDLHMLQVVRGAKYPMIVVRTEVSEAELKDSTIQANLQVQFAGQTAQFEQVSFQLARHGDEVRLTGTIPATLGDFKIPPPELLFVPIKNEIPINVNMTFRGS
jgi:YceI-like domain